MSGPFGVELPADIGGTSETSLNSDTINNQSTASPTPEANVTRDSGQGNNPPGTTQELLDLDKHERFRWGGKEWTRKDLQNSHLMWSDYTKKSQEVAETRRYADNFAHDLQTVLKNPSRLKEFSDIYPSKYVQAVEQILQSRQGNAPTQASTPPGTAQPQSNAELAEIKAEIQQWKDAQFKAQTESYTAWLQNQYESLGKKYEYAHPAQVTQWAQAMSERGDEISDSTLEKLFKHSNEAEKSRMDKMYKEKAEQQLTTGRKGKDMAAGGGVPSEPAKNPKTLKEARAAMEEHYTKARQ